MSEPRRLHARALGDPGARVVLDADAARHARVLRLRAGDRVVLFDGVGAEADAVVEHADATTIACVIDALRVAVAPTSRVVLVQALPKGGKLDDIVRACTETGVAAIHLALGERSVARPDADRSAARLDRLHKIAHEAARQAERAHIPAIVAPAPLAEVARRAPEDAARLIASPRAGVTWDEALEGALEAWIAVGPEGGLSPAEEDALVAAGWRRARVAVPIMRVETAAPVLVAMSVDRLARAALTAG
ncbi:RsmE family RNA methyltransferase [Sandaracinus amylolyticus]|uniref:Ribosomal RNA small subunit methyltransferase E n=1 Tax=Sandaracinus amylolyticus TaxID=927083 RepID=A0A0F6W704_9BACT|nr:16S rRNA (uracil(1498)-N(3))-methyltransferase [Sandaracinus amylolyticus]AKF09036.1 Ribosomal RNA small subunit methyltransferase E [Sandaracinus amylolyticus]